MTGHSNNSDPPGTGQYTLPNGMSIYHLNKYETEFTYKEIFEDQVYLKNGIELQKDSCIFDIGSNIGVFILFIKKAFPNTTIYAFEPAPQVNEILKKNVAAFEKSVQIFEIGISDKEESTTFTYYPDYSILSGFHADEKEDAETLSQGIINQIEGSESSDARQSERFARIFMKQKLKNSRQFQCQLRPLSALIKENKVEKINLLKIDAEKSELRILAGLEEKDWLIIDQIVMEAHSPKEAQEIITILKSKGFGVKTEQEDQFSNSAITNIFARRLNL